MGNLTKQYIVNEHTFTTQDEAIAYATYFYRLTGIIVAVEYVFARG